MIFGLMLFRFEQHLHLLHMSFEFYLLQFRSSHCLFLFCHRLVHLFLLRLCLVLLFALLLNSLLLHVLLLHLQQNRHQNLCFWCLFRTPWDSSSSYIAIAISLPIKIKSDITNVIINIMMVRIFAIFPFILCLLRFLDTFP